MKEKWFYFKKKKQIYWKYLIFICPQRN